MARAKDSDDKLQQLVRVSNEFRTSFPTAVQQQLGWPISVWMQLSQAKYPHKTREQLALQLIELSLSEDALCSFGELVTKSDFKKSDEDQEDQEDSK